MSTDTHCNCVFKKTNVRFLLVKRQHDQWSVLPMDSGIAPKTIGPFPTASRSGGKTVGNWKQLNGLVHLHAPG